jgi:hypothetical protein
MSRRVWVLATLGWVLAIMYVAAPVVAGAFGIGDRWGPQIYPTSFHEPLYRIGWNMTTWHEDGKPRIDFRQQPEWRPWFYGLPCRNDEIRMMPYNGG